MKKESGKSSVRLSLPRVNPRPMLACVLGVSVGIFLYTRIRFGGLEASDFLLSACLLPLLFFQPDKKNFIALMCCFCVFAAAGTVGIHVYTQNYVSGKEAGSYEVVGTVASVDIRSGYTAAELDGLLIGGDAVAGKLSLTVTGEDLRPGDRVRFTAAVSRCPLPADDGTDNYFFTENIRYAAAPETYEEEKREFHPFLFLNAKIYDVLKENMGGEEGNISYALLTGNSRMVDADFMTAVRRGGIAHIFAVSGLHIGILYGAALLLCRPLKKYAALPAVLLCTFYCALCGFSVSSVRALIMCAVLSVRGLMGRKTDMIGSVSFAGTAVLVFLPAQWLSVGFRLSFGACIGLALFSGMLSRGLKKAHIPRFLREYLSASLAVQLFTFPILIDAFGYFSVLGLALNLIVVPLLPAAFLTLLLCTALSLAIAPAAAFFLMFPKGLFALLLFLFAAADFKYVLTGFAFGAAGVVWLCACLYGSERVRLAPRVRVAALSLAAVLFTLSLVAQNCIFGGVAIDVSGTEDGMLALVRTEETDVLIVGEGVSLRDCEDFLARRTGRIDAAVVLSAEQADTLNIAAFTGAPTVYCMRESEDGFRETDVFYGKKFDVGELTFSYETDEVLMMLARGCAVKFDFGETVALRADLALEKGCGTLKYFLNYGIILLL